jgi:hypothetical protein
VLDPRDRFFRFVLPLGALALLSTVLVASYAAEPDRFTLGAAPAQPIAFSHRLHAGDNHIPCLYCHTGATRSRAAGVPPAQTCMNCHTVTRVDRPAVQTLARLVETGEALAWVRVHDLPDHVFFDHRPHVRAGIACQSCHGEVQTMERVSREAPLRMGKCLACHRDADGPTHCWACHR